MEKCESLLLRMDDERERWLGAVREGKTFYFPFYELTERRKRLNSGKEMYSKAGNRVDDENYIARNEKFINSLGNT